MTDRLRIRVIRILLGLNPARLPGGTVTAARTALDATEHAERDADVRAVAEACAGVVDGTPAQPIRHEHAVRRLRARFADRIAALDETPGSDA